MTGGDDIDEQLERDRRLYGESFELRRADGTRVRLDPRTVTFVPPPAPRSCGCGAAARQRRYDAIIAEEYGKPLAELTQEDRASWAMWEAHERTVARMADEDRGNGAQQGGNNGNTNGVDTGR
jgi:hypothetical protein